MDTLIEVTSVPIIASVVYGALTVYKNTVDGHEKLTKIIPLLAAVLGVILGIVAHYSLPEIMPADNVFTAILVGGASGLAATGTNQIFKQLIKENNKESENQKKGGE